MACRSVSSCRSYSVGGSTGLGIAAAGEPLILAALPPQAHRTSNRATASPWFRMARDYVTPAAHQRRVKPPHRRLGLTADAWHGSRPDSEQLDHKDEGGIWWNAWPGCRADSVRAVGEGRRDRQPTN